MPERSSLNQSVQIGVETTAGTAVAATKRLSSLSIEPSISVEKDNFRPSGQKFHTLSSLGKEWVEASLGGRATYDEIIYPLSSVLTTAVVTTPDAAGAPTARRWVFTPSQTAEDTPRTFTIEHGSAVRAGRFTYGLVTEFSMSFNRESIEVGGSMMGRALTDGITLTASPTALPLVPVLPTQVSVYLDTTSAALGTTKLTRLISGEFSLGSRFGPVWVMDAANTSYVAHVETEPDLTCTLTLQADSEGMGLLARLRDGATRFLRIEAIGALLGGTTTYRLTIDMAVKISDTGGFSDEDGVYAIEFTALGVFDSTYAKAVEVTVVNTQTAL